MSDGFKDKSLGGSLTGPAPVAPERKPPKPPKARTQAMVDKLMKGAGWLWGDRPAPARRKERNELFARFRAATVRRKGMAGEMPRSGAARKNFATHNPGLVEATEAKRAAGLAERAAILAEQRAQKGVHRGAN